MRLDQYFSQECLKLELLDERIQHVYASHPNLKELDMYMVRLGGQENVKNFYDYVYSHDEISETFTSRLQNRTRAQVEFIIGKTKPSDTILDVGCGAGVGTVALALNKPDYTVRGIDMSIPAIVQSKQRAIRQNSKVCFYPLNFIGSQTTPSDVVVSMNMLHEGYVPHYEYDIFHLYLDARVRKIAEYASKQVFIGLRTGYPIEMFNIVSNALEELGYGCAQLTHYNCETKKYDLTQPMETDSSDSEEILISAIR